MYVRNMRTLWVMKATFVEMSSFEKSRENYITDDDYSDLQQELLANPKKGDTISGTGGLRKVRWSDSSRGKGKRGGTRIIYYYFDKGRQFWMFLIYNKGEMSDLTREQKKMFRAALADEINARKRA